MRVIVEQLVERTTIAGETEVLGENLLFPMVMTATTTSLDIPMRYPVVHVLS
jgi:hypothetical protein